ncbi:MAG: RNA-binding transcriptional accessory protein, partial [Coprobacter sp.]|nr:RNA-binding transcriptional accessory protein [Coprobacter sp.]
MNIQFYSIIASALQITEKQVENTIRLLEEGATIPFISRYRKEVTGALDEVQIGHIRDRYDKLNELEKRKQTILATIENQERLTPELRTRIETCWDATGLEDIYLPYKPKRRTRADIAREKGLEPLARILMVQTENNLDSRARAFVRGEVVDVGEALKGARDIIAEWVSENERARNAVRAVFRREAVI